MKKSSYKPFPRFMELNFTQAGAVQNTWYPALNVRNAEIDGLAIGVTVANEDLELRITVDGEIMIGTVSVNLAQWSNMQSIMIHAAPNMTLEMAASAASAGLSYNFRAGFALKGQSILIEIRKTSAGGASALRVVGIYHLRG